MRPDLLDPTPDPRCGTDPGYRAHRARAERPCPACLAAHGAVARAKRATPAGLAASRAANRDHNRRARAAVTAHQEDLP